MKGRVDADRDHAVPQGRVGFRQTGEDDQACIVDERIDAPEAIERELDDAPARGCPIEIFVASGGDPAVRDDRRGHGIRHRRIEAAAILRDAGIVHDHGAAQAGDQPCIGRTQATTGPGDDHDLAVESNRAMAPAIGHAGSI